VVIGQRVDNIVAIMRELAVINEVAAPVTRALADALITVTREVRSSRKLLEHRLTQYLTMVELVGCVLLDMLIIRTDEQGQYQT
jgi:hypothetical protein